VRRDLRLDIDHREHTRLKRRSASVTTTDLGIEPRPPVSVPPLKPVRRGLDIVVVPLTAVTRDVRSQRRMILKARNDPARPIDLNDAIDLHRAGRGLSHFDIVHLSVDAVDEQMSLVIVLATRDALFADTPCIVP